MGGFFSENNAFFRFTAWLLDMLVLGLMWIISSLLVFTIIPASTALYYSCAKCLRCKEGRPYKSFIDSLKLNIATGSCLSLIFVPLLLLMLYGGFYLYFAAASMGGTRTILFALYLVFAMVPLGMMFCAVTMLSRFNYKIGTLLKDCFWVTMSDLPRFMGAAAMMVAVTLLSFWGFRFALPIFAPAVISYFSTYLIEPVLKKYTPDYDPNDETPPEERPWYLR